MGFDELRLGLTCWDDQRNPGSRKARGTSAPPGREGMKTSMNVVTRLPLVLGPILAMALTLGACSASEEQGELMVDVETFDSVPAVAQDAQFAFVG